MEGLGLQESSSHRGDPEEERGGRAHALSAYLLTAAHSAAELVCGDPTDGSRAPVVL